MPEESRDNQITGSQMIADSPRGSIKDRASFKDGTEATTAPKKEKKSWWGGKKKKGGDEQPGKPPKTPSKSASKVQDGPSNLVSDNLVVSDTTKVDAND